MKKYDSSEMFFTKDEILRFWQEEFVALDENCAKEFLASNELAKLSKLVKPAVYHGFIEKLKIIRSREILKQRKVWTDRGAMWCNDTGTWIVDDAISSTLDSMPSSWSLDYKFVLLGEWEKIYGTLDVTMKKAFLQKTQLNLFIRYKKSIVIAELVNHKKLNQLLAKLQSLEFEEQSVWNSQIEISTEFDWTSQIVLASAYFAALNTRFEKEIKLKPLKPPPGRTVGYEYQDSLSTCNACGMIIGLFNNHEC